MWLTALETMRLLRRRSGRMRARGPQPGTVVVSAVRS